MTTSLNASDMMRFHLTLRRRGISNQAVLKAMEEVSRDAFVAATDRTNAWQDNALPIACGQTISQPFVVAYMTERLNLSSAHRVLEIGTGSGYQAAVLSRLVKEVVSVERFRTLAETARERLAALGYANIEVQIADGLALPETIGSFDRIIVTAAVPAIPETLTDRLGPHGLLIAPVGPPQGSQMLTLLSRTAAGIGSQPLLNVRFVPALPGIAQEL